MSIITAIVGFLLTGVLGNYLIQKWQLRNWLTQQKFSSIEKEYSEIKELAEEFSKISNERLFSMRAVLYSLKINDKQLHKTRKNEYRDSIKTWNQKYGYFSAKLPFLMSQLQTQYFDEQIHKQLVAASSLLDNAISNKSSTPTINAKIENILIEVNRACIKLTNEILQAAKRKHMSIHKETKLPYDSHSIEKYSIWQLIKALFIKDVNSFSVVRSPLEP